MTSKEYVIWLKGFVEACHEYAPTPKQWDALTDKLKEVKDESIGFPIGVPTIINLPINSVYQLTNFPTRCILIMLHKSQDGQWCLTTSIK